MVIIPECMSYASISVHRFSMALRRKDWAGRLDWSVGDVLSFSALSEAKRRPGLRSTGTSAEENIVGIITVVNSPGILVKVLPTTKSYLYYFKICPPA